MSQVDVWMTLMWMWEQSDTSAPTQVKVGRRVYKERMDWGGWSTPLHPPPLLVTCVGEDQCSYAGWECSRARQEKRECQVWLQSGSDWPQIGQIRNFLRSDFSTIWLTDLGERKYTENLTSMKKRKLS